MTLTDSNRASFVLRFISSIILALLCTSIFLTGTTVLADNSNYSTSVQSIPLINSNSTDSALEQGSQVAKAANNAEATLSNKLNGGDNDNNNTNTNNNNTMNTNGGEDPLDQQAKEIENQTIGDHGFINQGQTVQRLQLKLTRISQTIVTLVLSVGKNCAYVFFAVSIILTFFGLINSRKSYAGLFMMIMAVLLMYAANNTASLFGFLYSLLQ